MESKILGRIWDTSSDLYYHTDPPINRNNFTKFVPHHVRNYHINVRKSRGAGITWVTNMGFGSWCCTSTYTRKCWVLRCTVLLILCFYFTICFFFSPLIKTMMVNASSFLTFSFKSFWKATDISIDFFVVQPVFIIIFC